MTRADLSKIGVPACFHAAVLDQCDRDHNEWRDRYSALATREGVRLAVQAIEDVKTRMSPADQTALNASLFSLTPDAAAAMAGCDRRTIDRALDAGGLKAIHSRTGLVILDWPIFAAWAAKRGGVNV